MNNKPLISIAILTCDRAVFLENLLNHIAPQAKESEGMVEICISNNDASDNTREVAVAFKNKYPGLIKYNENEKNLGFDRNVLKVMEMSQGDFVWLFGDDDMIVSNGIKKVIDFINNYCNKNTGLIALGHHESYIVDSKTGEKMVYFDTVEKDKPKVYKIGLKDIIGQCFPGSSFISALLFNNNFLKKILKEEQKTIKEATGNHFIHTFLYRLMFFKYPNLEAIRLNEKIIDVDLHYYKFYIEGKFTLHYAAQKKLNNLLLSSKYMKDYYRETIIKNNRGMMKGIIIEMGLMKSFKTFNYSSFSGCIKMFFQQTTFIEALLFSVFFVIFSIIPSVVLKNLYKISIKIRHKEWQKVWLCIVITYSEMSKGSRRYLF